jgi:beclin 1
MTQYNCQRCKLPLVIDTSLTNLSKAQTHLLTSGRLGYGSDRVDRDLGTEPFIPKERVARLNDAMKTDDDAMIQWRDTGDSFVILPQFEGQDEDEDEKVVSNRLKTLSSIFNLLSSKGELDYPVCADCSKLLLDSMKSQYDKTMKERDVYIQFLHKLESRQAPEIEQAQGVMDDVDKLKRQEQQLLKELQELESENDSVDQEIFALEDELKEISKQEEELQIQDNKQSLEISEFIKERDMINAEYEFNLSQLEKLRKTNVYNDTFNISHDGAFGTINGLRLGSLDHIRVPWQEINSALGQIVLLLATITARLNIKVQGYRLKPMGSTSKIEKQELDAQGKSKITILEVYSSGDYQIERLFNHSKLDSAMCALLEIVSQIGDALKKYDSNIDLPYKMTKDTIGDANIKLSSKIADDEWTSACKFLLTNTKWILAYSSAHIPMR